MPSDWHLVCLTRCDSRFPTMHQSLLLLTWCRRPSGWKSQRLRSWTWSRLRHTVLEMSRSTMYRSPLTIWNVTVRNALIHQWMYITLQNEYFYFTYVLMLILLFFFNDLLVFLHCSTVCINVFELWQLLMKLCSTNKLQWVGLISFSSSIKRILQKPFP